VLELLACGIAHLDLKLSNLVVLDGMVQLIDFGRVGCVNDLNLDDLRNAIQCIYSYPFVGLPTLPQHHIDSVTLPQYPSVVTLPPTNIVKHPTQCTFEPRGLGLIYEWGISYRFVNPIVTWAARQYTELTVQTPREALACLLLSLGLHNCSHGVLEWIYAKEYGLDSLEEVWTTLSTTSPQVWVEPLDDLQLVSFCHSFVGTARRLDVEVSLIDQFRELGLSIPRVSITQDGVVWILEL
jgi:hypothetical protein